MPALTIADSVVTTARSRRPAPPRRSTGVTVLGRVDVREIEATDAIFTGPAGRRRARRSGCVRFSYVAPGSTAPRRYRCQPDAALAAAPAAAAAAVRARVTPSFTSRAPRHPGYAQLGRPVPGRTRRPAATGGSEMGAFAFLHDPSGRRTCSPSLDDYLRFGLEAALIPSTDGGPA